METNNQTKEQRLLELEKLLADLKAKLPEHCSGTDSYVSDHRATPDHWLQIENTEEEIRTIKAEMGR